MVLAAFLPQHTPTHALLNVLPVCPLTYNNNRRWCCPSPGGHGVQPSVCARSVGPCPPCARVHPPNAARAPSRRHGGVYGEGASGEGALCVAAVTPPLSTHTHTTLHAHSFPTTTHGIFAAATLSCKPSALNPYCCKGGHTLFPCIWHSHAVAQPR